MNAIREGAKRLKGHWNHYGSSDGNGNQCGLLWMYDAADEQSWKYGSSEVGNMRMKGARLMGRVALDQYPDRLEADFSNMLHAAFGHFNDHEDTTEEEVLAVMEKAAILWDEAV